MDRTEAAVNDCSEILFHQEGKPTVGRTSLSQLKRYDATAIAQHYRLRPWRVLWRALRVTLLFVRFILGLKLDRWFDQVERNKTRRAVQLRQLLTKLGPTFIKVGQALSTRPDLIRRDFLDELVKLQDRLPPVPNDIAMRILEVNLDAEIDEVFSQISPEPVAAASLGQVYRAKLKTGEVVAVKVQRPDLLPTLTLDLYLMRWAAGWLAPWLPLNLGHDLTLIVDEFGYKLFEEIDYLNEGRNAEKFATNFRSDPQVKVPKIYWPYCTQRVLVLEWIDGVKLTDTPKLEAAGIDAIEVVRIGVVSGLKQLLEHGFFHADPHPGNLFAVKSGAIDQMAYIDFGMMDQLEEETKETLVDALVHLINKDYAELAQDFIRLGFLVPGTNIYPIVPALETVLGDIMGESVRDFNFKTVTDRFSELMFDYPFRVPAKFALIIRSVVTQEGLALTLDSNFKIVEVAYPYVAQRLLTGESPRLRRRLLEVLFKDNKFQWQRLENMIAIARSDRSFDLLPTAQLGLQYLLSEEGQFIRRQLLLALTEDDRFHTEEVQRLWNLIKDDIKPARLWQAAVSAIADFSTAQTAAILPSVMALTTPQPKR
jgi:predicted unusual protein kinase regulating ubiquinone biosynthesis (AarF/ABC1/UbiB family)